MIRPNCFHQIYIGVMHTWITFPMKIFDKRASEQYRRKPVAYLLQKYYTKREKYCQYFFLHNLYIFDIKRHYSYSEEKLNSLLQRQSVPFVKVLVRAAIYRFAYFCHKLVVKI